jgi:hypothetical protein
MRRMFAVFVIAVACGPSPGESSGEETGTDADESSGGEPTGGGAASWQEVPGGCGGLYGVVLLPGGDLVVAGELDSEGAGLRPWVARYAAGGEQTWSVTLTEMATVSGFIALDRVDDDVIAVGYRKTDGPTEPLLVRFAADDGAVVWTRTGEPVVGGLYGAAWSADHATLWTTGSADGALLVNRYDDAGELAASLDGPGGGYSVGFAVALAGPDDVVVCGRSSVTEGGQSWLGRYGIDGELQWSATGPDPGVGAFADCWDVAVGSQQGAAVAEAGYKGARVARHGPDGALAWEFAEPDAGAQAVDFVADDVLVAGWSASREDVPMMDPMGLRSHSSGDRHGWLRRFGPGGGEPTHTWLDITGFSPRDMKVHPDGGAVIVGQLVPPDACPTPWLGRIAFE